MACPRFLCALLFLGPLYVSAFVGSPSLARHSVRPNVVLPFDMHASCRRNGCVVQHDPHRGWSRVIKSVMVEYCVMYDATPHSASPRLVAPKANTPLSLFPQRGLPLRSRSSASPRGDCSMMAKPVQLPSGDSFELFEKEVLQSQAPVLVDFHAA